MRKKRDQRARGGREGGRERGREGERESESERSFVDNQEVTIEVGKHSKWVPFIDCHL